MDVYLDLVVLLNFGVDLLLLWGTNRLSGRSAGGKRTLLSAALGGGYAGACLLPGFSFLGNFLWRMVSMVMMSGIAFGWNKSALQRGALFVFLSMALGGVVLLMGRSGFWEVLMSAVILCVLCFLGFNTKNGNPILVPVEITHRNQTVNMTALLDTGNTLIDPVSGHPVLVADACTAWKLLGLDQDALNAPVETISRGIYTGLRLIPYCAIGQPAGMLLGLKVDKLRINGEEAQRIVAFAPQRIGQGKDYEALIGGSV